MLKIKETFQGTNQKRDPEQYRGGWGGGGWVGGVWVGGGVGGGWMAQLPLGEGFKKSREKRISRIEGNRAKILINY